MTSPFRTLVFGALAFAAALAGSTFAETRAYHVDAAGRAYRLEIDGSLADTARPFEARLFRLEPIVRSLRSVRDPSGVANAATPVAVTPLPFDPAAAALAGPPDAVWSLTPNGSTTLVAIRVGADLVEAAVVSDTVVKTVGCWPEDPPLPLWLEINGTPVDVPDARADLQADVPARTKNGRGTVPLSAPERFVQGFFELHGAVLATLVPAVEDFAGLAKGSCNQPCTSCANGILRVMGFTAGTALTCSTVGVSGGSTGFACVLVMVTAHAAVVDAGIRCAACNRCVGSPQREPPDEGCDCPCLGQPECDCVDCDGNAGPGDELP